MTALALLHAAAYLAAAFVPCELRTPSQPHCRRCSSVLLASADPPDPAEVPGTLLDTTNDGKPDAVAMDTSGEGVADTVMELTSLPFQREAASAIANPAFEIVSVLSTLTLVATFSLEGLGELDAATMGTVEQVVSLVLSFEYAARFWASGASVRFLVSPLMLLDAATLLPTLLELYGTLTMPPLLAPLRLLRAARILRLRRFFSKESFAPIVAALFGGEASEVQRIAARVAFSVVSIVLVSAGVEWQLERAVNPGVSSTPNYSYHLFCPLENDIPSRFHRLCMFQASPLAPTPSTSPSPRSPPSASATSLR